MSEVASKRVLIVDDEPGVALTLSLSLKKLEADYVFEVAYTGDEALAKLQQSAYDLLITDYSMPGMNGLDLVRAVRQLSPKTQIVLMTAHGAARFQGRTEELGLDDYLDKPFSLDQIRRIVKRAAGLTRHVESPPAQQLPLDQHIDQQLKSLQIHSGAQCVLLISANGYPIGVVGRTAGLDITGIGALVAGNFMAAAELANLLGSNRPVFTSSYHEGADYNIYAYNVNGELLLTVIFGPTSKPGIVWFYTKQTAAELSQLVVNQPLQGKFAEALDSTEALNSTLETVFDGLFENTQENSSDLPTPPASPPVEAPAPSRDEAGSRVSRPRENTTPLSFEQAVAAGLVPPQLVKREQGK